MNRKFTLFCSCLLFCFFSSFAQNVIKGRISDANDGSGIPGASILIKGTTSGTSTNNDGIYTLTVPTGGATLVISALGFTTKEIPINNRTTVDVELQSTTQSLSEVTVVGAFGITREKRSLGYSTQVVQSEELNENRQTNVVNALQGKVAGVTISSSGGAPGQGASIQIRGINSLDPNRSNEPLFVIDGVIIDNSTSTVGDQADLRGMSNRSADINPQDIETINVLKGGAATALYGLRGSNGVVVITTKSGQAGATRINVSTTTGIDVVNRFPAVQQVYTQGFGGIYDPANFFPRWGPTVAEAKAVDPTHPDQLFDTFDEAYDTGWQSKNTLSISGGSEKIVYTSSFSYFKQDGTIPYTDYQNISGKLSGNIKFSEKFQAGASVNYINSGGDRYNADRYNENISYWSPRWSIKDFLTPQGTMNSYGNDNPLYGPYTNKFEDNVNRVIGNINFNYHPTSWLNFTYRAGVDAYTDKRERTAPGPQGFPGERVFTDNGGGFIYNYNTNSRIITSTFIATANRNITDDIKATLRVGHDISDSKSSTVSVTGDTLAVYNNFNISNARNVRGSNNRIDYRLMGVFGELSFDYKNYLFLTLTGRNDWTSSLLKPNNSFFYPSASVSYVFSDHLKLPEVISFAKFRFSYAQVGKDALPYSYSTGFVNYQSLGSGFTGYMKGALLGDPDLKPEFTDTYDGGFELQFFKNRLGLDISYYYSESKDQIIAADISSATGYVRAAVNAGSMRNKGIELAISGTPIKTDAITWDVGLTFSANRNKILDLAEGLEEIILASQFGYSGSTVTSKLIEGNAYGDLFGTGYARYNSNYDGYLIDNNDPWLIGENGFPVKRTNLLIANSQPKWIGGLTTTLRYKDFTLNALFDTRQGQYKYNQLDNFFAAFGIAKYTLDRNDTKVFNGVLADGSPNTKAVWLGQGVGPDGVDYGDGYYRNGTYGYRGFSENFVQDASWFRLRSLSITYNLPAKLLTPLFVKNASVSLTGNNLWLHTNYKGFDPETSFFNSGSNVTGFSGFSYPATRSFLFTLNVGF
ncbi:SusC/RagA family TonB-linked outer membrane protein [Pedobacter immunditicola]|uniref:SusC/RagA family TonB-linked outer membrane protein n=1 Tax=Pedobacter immunditicola TaxID=3133440 RepID=UPI0030B6C321